VTVELKPSKTKEEMQMWLRAEALAAELLIKRFTERFKDRRSYAFQWNGIEALESALRTEVCTSLDAALSDKATPDTLIEWLYRRVLDDARHVSNSTSVMANESKRLELALYAEILNKFTGGL
jgi:hypothetical protein